MKKAFIIGAGPAGLTAAYELLKQSDEYEVTVFEESFHMGGISKTVNYKGNRMDMGGHRFFSKVPEVNAWWEQMLPMQGAPAADDIMLQRDVPLEKGGPDPQKEDRVMLNRNRVSRIYFDQKFYDYPIQLKPELFMNMGFLQTMQVGFSYLASLSTNARKTPSRISILIVSAKSSIPCSLNTTPRTSGDVTQGIRSQLGRTARKGTFHYCDFKRYPPGKSYRPKKPYRRTP